MPRIGNREGRGQPGHAILIAGPTASGKSALALKLAIRTGAVIVNVDSMQVYGVLDRLTARPQAEELKQATHRLYGHVDPRIRHSAGAWLEDVSALMAEPDIAGRPLIFVGGTGLYFRALLGGLSEMPAIPERVRARWRHELAEKGAAGLHRLLRRRDPETAMTLKPGDGQRIVRALEVLEVTGVPIGRWQARAGVPLIDPRNAEFLLVEPDRERLRARIERRFENMIRMGAMEEVRRLHALDLDPGLPAMKAIGVRELRDADEGRISLDEAIAASIAATRRYAKRQATWFRHQAGPEWKRLADADLDD